jgi:hypothetical protein
MGESMGDEERVAVGAHRRAPKARRQWLAVAAVLIAAALLGAYALAPPGVRPSSDPGSPAALPPTPGPTMTPAPSVPATASPHPSAQATPPTSPRTTPVGALLTSGVFFDDFAYGSTGDAAFQRAWSVRTDPGAPGQSGANWSANTVGFSGSGSATVMTMTASTDGSPGGTTHSEVDSTRARFFEGTFATRIRFADQPSGPAGAHVNETYFLITDSGDDSPTYSEMDFEYLPTGGWGDNRTQLDFTSWHTSTDSREGDRSGSLDGWHTLVLTVGGGTATYYVDGNPAFSTSGAYYPRAPMLIAFNEWFIDGELGPSGATRSYTQQVDWTYFANGRVLTPAQVQAQVAAERAAGRTYVDSLS